MSKFETKNALVGYFWILSCLESAHLILSNCKILRKKQKCLNLELKMPYLGIFGLKFKINVSHIWNQYPHIYLIAKCCEKTRTRTFGLEFQKTIVIFRISTLEFVYLQNFTKKAKMPKFGTKNALFGYFGLRFLNIIVIFEISTLEFVQLQDFYKKNRNA